MKRHWDDPNHVFNLVKYRKGVSEHFKKLWVDPKSVLNSITYRKALSEALTGRSWTLTGPQHQPPLGVVLMQPCGYCGQPYHFRKVGQHQNQCPKNPDNMAMGKARVPSMKYDADNDGKKPAATQSPQLSSFLAADTDKIQTGTVTIVNRPLVLPLR